MTNKELQEELKKYDNEIDVCINDSGSYVDITKIKEDEYVLVLSHEYIRLDKSYAKSGAARCK